MSKTIIIYGSTGGNTQSVAERIEGKIKEAGKEVVLKNVIEATVEELQDYDNILLGSSTWNDGDLQEDFVGYQMQIEEQKPSLAGKKAAIFGCGESIYEHFCGAVDMLEKTVTELGATKIAEGLKIDGYPEEEDNVKKTEDWIASIVPQL